VVGERERRLLLGEETKEGPYPGTNITS